jgi:putative ABC transport system permease protein
VGDTLTLLGQTSYRSLGGLSLVITGLATSGVAYLDNSLLIVSIDQAQLMADLPDGATEILVFARESDRAGALAVALSDELNPLVPGGLEVLPWDAMGSLIRMLETARPMFNVIFAIMLLMASLIIVNTMLMTVMERTQEFGMESALGMRRSDIVAMVLAEGLVIGLLGGIAGGLLGTGLSVWVESTGLNFTQAVRGIEMPFQGMVYPDWKAIYTFSAIVVGMIAAVAATIYPALRAVRLSPAEALRS